MPRPTRHAILESRGLSLAPRQRQRAFWQGYNTPARKRLPDMLGGHALRALADLGRGGSGRGLEELAEAWHASIPDEFTARTMVEGLRGGVLSIAVDGAATRYALERMMAPAIRAGLAARLGAGAVRRITYRIQRSLAEQSPPAWKQVLTTDRNP